jgi:RecA/RadA recombinase
MKPFDPSKLIKAVNKSVPNVSIGFNDPQIWLSTGCYLLNYLISGNYKKGIPLEGKITCVGGESGCLPETAEVILRSNLANKANLDYKTITVGELKNIYFENKNKKIPTFIETPDGSQEIINWFNKGQLPCVKVITESGKITICATNHMLETIKGWVLAENSLNENVIVFNNKQSFEDKVVEVIPYDSIKCYDFEIKHPNHRYWGDGFSSHNSGKSYIVSGNLVKDAQEKGIFVVMFDTENALDEEWLHNLGVDTDPGKLMRINVAMIDDVAKTTTKILEEYKETFDGVPYSEQAPILFIIDSLGMLITPNNERQFEEGDMKGDMGIKAKQLTALMRGISAKIANKRIGMICTNHVYAAHDQYSPDTLAGGKMVEYATSIIIQMNKLLLKEDEFGNKLTDGAVAGIRSSVVVRKTRYNKPFEKMKIEIPYEQGMNPYSGLFDFFISRNILIKEGNRYSYTSPVTGEILKDFRKNFKYEWLDQIMEEWSHWTKHVDQVAPVEIVED